MSFPKKITEDQCEYCDAKLVQDWRAKNSFRLGQNRPYCPICSHENHDQCKCSTCEEQRREALIKEENRKKNLIREHYNQKNYEKKLEENLSLEDKLFLSVLIRGGLDENLGHIVPIWTLDNKLTPSNSFTIELIKTLAGRGLIVPHSNSSIEAFVDDETFPGTYYVDRVLYRININSLDNNYHNMIERLMYPSQGEFEADKDFCFNMWKKIALNESIEYLLYSFNKVGFDFNPGEKTHKVFENLLNHYSVAQVYSIIYRAVANSTKLYQEKKMPKKRAANAVITSCENFGERAIAEGWKLSKFRRDYNLPETVISKVFFTSILKIAYIGFEEKPTPNI
ncbi:hypothetical protein Len3610_19175 [Lentibacillus sp. CBA3610]|nr:hypothetical protein Len3610_19175 [Lentibacillus sp. CBA3610]